MKVYVFKQSANADKFDTVLNRFAKGVIASGDECDLVDGLYRPCDVAVIWGSWKNRDTVWHNVKNSVVSKAKKFIVLETPLIGRLQVKDVGDDIWFRIGVNGFLSDTGNFNNTNRPNDRWKQIQKHFNLQVKPYKKGDNIVVALQIPGDASLRGINISKWVRDVCFKLRNHTDRPIVIRTPQIERLFDAVLLNEVFANLKDVYLEKGTKENLLPSLNSCWATVTCTSGLGIDSYIEGVPSFTDNPSSFVYSLGNNDISNIETPIYQDRDQWLSDLSYAQWNEHEIEQGLPWRHLKEIL